MDKIERRGKWPRPSVEHRLMSRVEKRESGCWEWTGPKHRGTRKEYGNVWLNGRNEAAHRVSAYLWLGFDLSTDKVICHKCDNPPCVNPGHLFIGTMKDNVADMKSKGRDRYVRGEETVMAKLSESQAMEILMRVGTGESGSKIAREFGVSVSTVCDIKKKRTWSWLT